MSAARFFDTNILVYAHDLTEPKKREIALKLVAEAWVNLEGNSISIQVLQEMWAALIKRGATREAAFKVVKRYEVWPIMENTLELWRAALKEQERWEISIWDAVILAAARAAGARELISEDFNHGQDYGGVVAVNPFK